MKINTFDEMNVVAGEYYALRQFFLRDGALTGVSYQQVMLPGSNQSICHAPGSNHDMGGVPEVNCTCGWYSFKNNELWTLSDHPDLVTAIVKLSGKLVLNEKGYRAEYMEVIARTYSKNEKDFLDNQPHLNPLHDSIYDIPVYKNNSDLLKKHPTSDQRKKRHFIVDVKDYMGVEINSGINAIMFGSYVGFIVKSLSSMPSGIQIASYVVSFILIIVTRKINRLIGVAAFIPGFFYLGWSLLGLLAALPFIITLSYVNIKKRLKFDKRLMTTALQSQPTNFLLTITNKKDLQRYRDLHKEMINIYHRSPLTGNLTKYLSVGVNHLHCKLEEYDKFLEEFDRLPTYDWELLYVNQKTPSLDTSTIANLTARITLGKITISSKSLTNQNIKTHKSKNNETHEEDEKSKINKNE